MKTKTNFLVIGSGIAGLSYALRLALKFPEKQVHILTKAKKEESNTRYAQGGLAAVSNFQTDSYEKHVEDTMIAGAGLCKEEVVRMVVNKGAKAVRDLIDWGVKFDDQEDGEFDLGKEGGHSESRILHHKDITGLELERSLLRHIESCPNINLLEDYFALELITEHHLSGIPNQNPKRCFGVYALNKENNSVEIFQAGTVLLASGGIGQVYLNTTNPRIATGDGIAMAYRAGAQIKDMEFIQFHPTAFYDPSESPAFLISEALRGFGAVLKNNMNQEFMHHYHDQGSLAPRDIVARAIDTEMKKDGADCMYLDCTPLDQQELSQRFPNIVQYCLSKGIVVAQDMIPVVPAAHYACGGVKVNMKGETSIQNLYAIGECAWTGLHGANRLASNSLLEAVVFSDICFKQTSMNADGKIEDVLIPEWDIVGVSDSKEAILVTHNRKELRGIMNDYVGIYRSTIRLKRAFQRLRILYKETESLYDHTTITQDLCELRNQIAVAYLITSAALLRKENIGLHFNTDLIKNPSLEGSPE